MKRTPKSLVPDFLFVSFRPRGMGRSGEKKLKEIEDSNQNRVYHSVMSPPPTYILEPSQGPLSVSLHSSLVPAFRQARASENLNNVVAEEIKSSL